MWRSVILIISFLVGLEVQSQELIVKDFRHLEKDLSARAVNTRRFDSNGNLCALVKVEFAAPNSRFDGYVVGDVANSNSTYWVYMTGKNPASRHITLSVDGFLPLNVYFSDYDIQSLKDGETYKLIVAIPEGYTFNTSKKGRPLSVDVDFEVPRDNFMRDNKWRMPEDSLKHVMVYVNKKGDNYDERVEHEVGKGHFLLGNINIGDVLTLIPQSDYYQELTYVVQEEDLNSQRVELDLLRKRIDVECRIIDDRTNLPVRKSILNIYSGVDYGFKYHWSKENTLMGETKAVISVDSTGCVKIKDIMPENSYDYRFDYLPNGYVSPNICKSGPTREQLLNFKLGLDKSGIEFRITPNKIYGYVTDGKNPIKGAKVETKSLYGEVAETDEKGYFELYGYSKFEPILFSAPGYDNLRLLIKVDEFLEKWEAYDMEKPLNISLKKAKKPKERVGSYDYIDLKVRHI